MPLFRSRTMPVPSDEPARQSEVDRLPSRAAANPVLDEIAAAAAAVVGAPAGAVTIVDHDLLEFAGRFNLAVPALARAESLCAHGITDPGNVLCVPDVQADARFADLSVARGEAAIRFYAGAPILSRARRALGMLCVLDGERRAALDERQCRALQRLARVAAHRLEQPAA